MNIFSISHLPKITQISLDKDLLDRSLLAMRSARPGSWTATYATAGQIKGAIFGPGLVAIVLIMPVKPPVSRIAVIMPKTGRVLLPSENSQDLLELCRETCSTGLEASVILHEFCNCDFGVYVKMEPPVLLSSAEDYEACGLGALITNQPSAENESIWWQRWGGKLFKVVYAKSPDSAIFIRTAISSGVGLFKRLPFYVTR